MNDSTMTGFNIGLCSPVGGKADLLAVEIWH